MFEPLSSRFYGMVGAKPYGKLQHKEVAGKRMAYVDEGEGDAIVFQHGNPTSSTCGAM